MSTTPEGTWEGVVLSDPRPLREFSSLFESLSATKGIIREGTRRCRMFLDLPGSQTTLERNAHILDQILYIDKTFGTLPSTVEVRAPLTPLGPRNYDSVIVVRKRKTPLVVEASKKARAVVQIFPALINRTQDVVTPLPGLALRKIRETRQTDKRHRRIREEAIETSCLEFPYGVPIRTKLEGSTTGELVEDFNALFDSIRYANRSLRRVS